VDVNDFDYALPPDLIAQHPRPERTDSRLMVLDRATRSWEHGHFRELPACLRAGDLLVLNDTRVLPVRLIGRKDSGGAVRCLLVTERQDGTWHALLEASGRLRTGNAVYFEGGLTATLLGRHPERGWVVRFEPQDVRQRLAEIGRAPLPPYIHREKVTDPYRTEDLERYQTVFARSPGAIAAPTAGLHFTDAILDELKTMGVTVAYVTLHVGLGTFLPMKEERVEDHLMHREWVSVSAETVEVVQSTRTRGGRVVACGTTVVRALESACREGTPGPFVGETDLFITPGHRFQAVDALITNFHLPRSTLLVLVSAFAGRSFVLGAYREAVAKGYRFYSYGDCMLIL
jgi:S-adenosylmethionine:tRNA ribosyltransferase-isomerase